MTEIKIAQAWGWNERSTKKLSQRASHYRVTSDDFEVLVVHGLAEHELRELVERRGVCEWEYRFKGTIESGHRTACGVTVTVVESARLDASFCPSCGRKVQVIE